MSNRLLTTGWAEKEFMNHLHGGPTWSAEAMLNKIKPAKKDYNTIGVRFVYGDRPEKVYTYKVRKGVKLHLGQLVVTSAWESTNYGKYIPSKVAVVVEIHKTPQDTGPFQYKFIESKVAPL